MTRSRDAEKSGGFAEDLRYSSVRSSEHCLAASERGKCATVNKVDVLDSIRV
jgi:hypothetical protein